MKRVLIVLGTRPEVIKLGPVYRELIAYGGSQVDVFLSGQHRELIEGLLPLFDMQANFGGEDLRGLANLPEKLSTVLFEVNRLLQLHRYDWLIVQGDTTTAMAGAFAGFLNKTAVAHVEGGLRTFDLQAPWPEEFNRRAITLATTVHFAPTKKAKHNLIREGVRRSSIEVTGNTALDALLYVRARVRFNYVPLSEEVRGIPSNKKLILVTGHRRENAGEPLRNIIKALRSLAADGDKVIVWPVHPNPQVHRVVHAGFAGIDDVLLLTPLYYSDFVYLMEKAWTIVTDSGGIQEEFPSFHRPTVVTRTCTERPEAVETGFSYLAGSDPNLITSTVRQLTAGISPTYIEGHNPFGDGNAASRIVSRLQGWPAKATRATTA